MTENLIDTRERLGKARAKNVGEQISQLMR